MRNFIIKINYFSHILLTTKYSFFIKLLIYFLCYYVYIIKCNTTATFSFCEQAVNSDEQRIEGTLLFLSFFFLWMFLTTSIPTGADIILTDLTAFDIIPPSMDVITDTTMKATLETNTFNVDLSKISNDVLFSHLIQNEEKFFIVRHDPETIKTLIAIWDEIAPNAELPPKLELWAKLNHIPIRRQMNCWGMQYEIE